MTPRSSSASNGHRLMPEPQSELTATPMKDRRMESRRFGKKLTLPATVAIKRQFYMLMLADEIGSMPSGQTFKPDNSDALKKLRRLPNALDCR